ncbi:predicted protein [Histoplasma capsulatum var. duboisii H88]|uniref:Predicted protein n=2 Tax=Ajellomyces capsulatus TaxID=5037 RepID=F0UH11_AJEC8|nr:predicted protein [Histoplasma capsulatum H143]EGC44410.1 predicted protein [Histoplasma capsulatum var. duboisii H88]QSS55189.1 hypothetical protein I7I53_03001 [Histoplasma capsulatum var. duboisii H88]
MSSQETPFNPFKTPTTTHVHNSQRASLNAIRSLTKGSGQQMVQGVLITVKRKKPRGSLKLTSNSNGYLVPAEFLDKTWQMNSRNYQSNHDQPHHFKRLVLPQPGR